jgi:sugar (pentulose or hexulose) kinase
LSLDHTTGHLFRALIEAVCMGTRLIVENYETTLSINRIVAGGGATKSPLWMQIHADTLNKAIEAPEFLDAPLLGCAVVSAAGLGRYPNIDAAAQAMVRIGRRYEPNPASVRLYDDVYDRYVRLYSALRGWRLHN